MLIEVHTLSIYFCADLQDDEASPSSGSATEKVWTELQHHVLQEEHIQGANSFTVNSEGMININQSVNILVKKWRFQLFH